MSPWRPGSGRPPLRSWLRLAPYLLAVLAVLAVCAKAGAYTVDARLSAVASLIAGHEIEVRCYVSDEADFPGNYDAWGYVFRTDDRIEFHDGMLCAAVNQLAEPALSPWLRALSALVFTHESYHLNMNVPGRLNEGRTECRAIKATRFTIRALGGDPDELYPYARKLHRRLVRNFPWYGWPGCKVP